MRDAARQIDVAAFAEIGARRARRGIERDQAGVDRRDEDALAAAVALRAIRIDPQADAAIDEAVGRRTQIGTGIEAPDRLAGLRIERDDSGKRRGQVHHAVDDDGRGLERAPRTSVLAVRNIAGVVFPRDLEPCDIAFVDLRQRRISLAAGIAAVMRPFGDRTVGGRLGLDALLRARRDE